MGAVWPSLSLFFSSYSSSDASLWLRAYYRRRGIAGSAAPHNARLLFIYGVGGASGLQKRAERQLGQPGRRSGEVVV